MRGRNYTQNNEYFNSLADSVAGEEEKKERVHSSFPTQLKVGQLVKFSYANTGWDYTGVVASTKRAPKGRYVAANTRNLLITMFLIDNYTMRDQETLLNNLYNSGPLKKRKLASYKPEFHNDPTFGAKGRKGFMLVRMERFWEGLLKKLNIKLASGARIDSRNFRTFISMKMQHCKVLR